MARRWDAVVVGAGPNGLAAAITLLAAGRSVRLVEAADTVGGGTRSASRTLAGFRHDLCSAVHPLAVASPFLRSLPLPAHGLEMIFPPVEVAHPLDDGDVVLLHRSLDRCARELGPDGEAHRRLFGPLVARADALMEDVLAPPLRIPSHPLLMARFGARAVRSAHAAARALYRGDRARALFAGLAAHAALPLHAAFSAAFGVIFMVLGHAHGWPVARGGSQSIADALGEPRARPRRGDRDGTPRRVASGAAARARGAARHEPADTPRHRRRAPAAPLPARARALPPRPGRVQDRLRPVRAHPMARARS